VGRGRPADLTELARGVGSYDPSLCGTALGHLYAPWMVQRTLNA
jgi:hypothetical protein